jgi:hypothetical protein
VLDPTAALTPILHLTRAEVLQEVDDDEELSPPQAEDRQTDEGSKKKCLIS